MSKVRPEVAKQRIKSFEKRFGKGHLYLAYHAAFPLSLTPDLLYRLWANFQRDIHGEVLGIPWIAVADILLSNLCDEVGYELYEIDLAVRNMLLSQLKDDEKFGQQRIYELSNFLLVYVRQQLLSDEPDTYDLAQAQRWVALSYTQPSEVARELALAFSQLDEKDTAELVRMESLTETFAEPLAKFQPLLIYARAMGDFARGNLKDATDRLREVPKKGNVVEVAGVNLLIPKQLQKKAKRQLNIHWRSLSTTFLTSVGFTILIMVLRLSGFFQPSELFFFDLMMRSQPVEEQDDKLLIVKMTSEDRKYYARLESPKNGRSLADKFTYELLDRLLKYNPRTIGIHDYRRYAKSEGGLEKLINSTQTDKRLVFICDFPEVYEENEGLDPPPDVPIEQVGLGNVLSDSDKVIRRQIIRWPTPSDTPSTKSTECKNRKQEYMDSFSFLIAQKYLSKEEKEYKYIGGDDGLFKSGETILQPLDNISQGGYNFRNLNAYQIFLYYRYTQDSENKRSLSSIAKTLTIREVLEKGVKEKDIKDKIVLIGTPITGFDNTFSTPFSTGGADSQIRGLFIEAQMISQLVNAALGTRPLLKVWNIQYDILWILCWSLIGAIIFQLYTQPRKLILAVGISLCCLYLICFVLFISPIKRWLPFVPPAFSFSGAGLVVVLIKLSRVEQQPEKLSLGKSQ
ncbi:hypothetical protein WA1_22545 [Scytonema hofmannii PCC 7110]|uniref:CHASE2 domain-containing protein n=1 Tax=Scytonema hofmannii PCC 7110 TaxID=128403 RepID=A0A139X981_9CYAN|nr:CHASE2 domain-containing protein [Scytonema hofmannii]KYC41247.1 hypothetical protein WA1_22545 [Scytonema hofmannii PCC 7110]